MQKYILLCFYILVSNLTFAQKYQVVGKVISELDSVKIEQAIVSCHPDSTRKWSFTDKYGYFELNDVPSKTTKISISCVGYKKKYIPVDFKDSRIDIGTILLPIEIYKIKDVRIEANIPLMTRYGDTIQYNAAAYKMNEEWSAFDLIKRFPGVFMIDNKIIVNGKPLLKVLLDGKEYSGENVLSTLLKVPASAINNVQSYDKQSNFARLTGFKDGEEVAAFNLRTKNPLGVKGWLNADGAEGINTNGLTNNLYGVSVNGTIDNPTHRITADGKITNLNGIAGNGFSEVSNSPITGSIPILNKISESQTLELDYAYTKDKIKFNVGGAIFNSKNSISSYDYKKYFPTADVSSSNESVANSINSNESTIYNFNADFEWSFNPKHTIYFSSSYSPREHNTYSIQREYVLQGTDSVSRYELKNRSAMPDQGSRGRLSWYYRISPKKRTLVLEFNYYLSLSNGINKPLGYINEVYDKTSERWEESATNSNIMQLSDANNRSCRVELMYMELISEKHQLMFTANYNPTFNGNLISAYNYNSETNDYTTYYKARSNDTDLGNDNYGINLNYNYSATKKFTLNSRIGINYIEQYYRDQINTRYNATSRGTIPYVHIAMSQKLTPESNIKFEYSLSGSVPYSHDLLPVIRDNSLSQITIGNPYLKNSKSNHFELSYLNNKKSTLSASLSFSLTSNAVVDITEFMPTDKDTVLYVLKTPTNSADQGYIPQRGAVVTRKENRSGEMNISSNVMYGFYIKPLSSSLSISLHYTYRKANAYSGMTDFIRNHNTLLHLSLTSNITKNLDFNFIYRNIFSARIMNGQDNFNKYTTTISGQLSYSFLKCMRLCLLGMWYNQKLSDKSSLTNNSLQLDAGLGVYLNSGRNWLLSLNGKNMLNSEGGISDVVTTTYFLQSIRDGFGRYVSLKLSYKFNSMTKKPKLKKGEKTNSGGFFNN